MEGQVPLFPADQPKPLNGEHHQARFPLWISFHFASEESDIPTLLTSFMEALSTLDTQTLLSALRALGELGRLLPDGPKKGIITSLLTKHMDDDRIDVQITAGLVLSWLAPSTSTATHPSKFIINAYAHLHMASTEILGKLLCSLVFEGIKDVLSDPNWQVRATGIDTLGNVGKRLIIEPLQAALGDPDIDVRNTALYTLGIFKMGLSTEYLVSLAQQENGNWTNRETAVTILERLGEQDLARPFREQLNRELEAEE